MTKSTQKIIDTMETFNPYANKENEEIYFKVWDAVQTFRALGIISEKEFKTIWDFDNKLFTASF